MGRSTQFYSCFAIDVLFTIDENTNLGLVIDSGPKFDSFMVFGSICCIFALLRAFGIERNEVGVEEIKDIAKKHFIAIEVFSC